MQQPRVKPITKALQPSLRSIQATDNEIIILQAALHHYRDYIRSDKDFHAQTAPLIQNFIQRLHDQLPPRREQIEGQ
jgi:hypothetical protein